MSLRYTLAELGRYIVDRYPTVNSGGCCVFASVVGRELLNRGIDVKIIVGSKTPVSNLEVIRNTMKDSHDIEEWNMNGVVFNHIAIELPLDGKMFFFDADGLSRADRSFHGWGIHPGRLTVAEAESMAMRDDAWNDMFDRKHVSKMARRIRSFLNDRLPSTV